MEKTIRKWFMVWDFEKEEEWLNEMALSGWVLDGVGFCSYHFSRCEPGEYTVRLEMHPQDEPYLQFMRDTGAEYVGRMLQWIYFRKKTTEGSFDLFSDIDSRIAHLNKIGRMLSLVGAANLIDPWACQRIIEALPAVLDKYGIHTLQEIIGGAH